MSDEPVFSDTLIRALESSTDPFVAGDAACAVVAERFGVERVVYVHIVPDAYIVECEHCNGARPIRGQHPASEFSEILRAELMAGVLRAVDDVRTDSHIPDKVRSAFDRIGVRAYVAVAPFVEGTGLSGLGAHSSSPRSWTPTEIELFADVAKQMCTVLERLHGHRDREIT